jgi:CDP-glycerol glycerophosphotransferase (TagB/SpsB family)
MDVDREGYSGSVVFDDSKTLIRGEKKYTEILRKDMDHLADSLYHTEMTISTASTMTIDAAAFDKPSINIAFDGWEEKPFHESVRRFYAPSHAHYQPIVKSAGVRIAYSFDELIKYIHMYLEDPSIDKEGRARIVREQCYKLDGKSGERIANFILESL